MEALEKRLLFSGSAWGPLPFSYSPQFERTAYGLGEIPGSGSAGITFGNVPGYGQGQTIAILIPYDDPNIIGDANNFSAQFGLSQFNGMNEPTLIVRNEQGGSNLPSSDPNLAFGQQDFHTEEALDVETAHLIAPDANIAVFEMNSSQQSDLDIAARTAAAYPGVSVVSMSLGGIENASEVTNDDPSFVTQPGHQGVTFLAATGDFGSASIGYPALSPNVVAVGGTVLTTNADGSYGGEVGWSGSGGGISQYELQPSYQIGKVSGTSSTYRVGPDVSMDSNGIYIYDSYQYNASDGGGRGLPWTEQGGTSFACAMWAGLIAIADQGRAYYGLPTLDGATGTLPILYDLPSSDFHDITTGNNGYAAGPGYDLVTGLGSPIANLLVPDLVRGGPEQDNLVVNSAADGPVYGYIAGGTLTLREAITLARTNSNPTTITFDPSVFPSTQQTNILLTVGQLEVIGGTISIDGPGSGTLVIDAQNNSRVFFFDPGVTASLSGVTMSSGDGVGGDDSGDGGSIYNSGTLTISQCVVEDSAASLNGGGIFDFGFTAPLTVMDSTITGNTADSPTDPPFNDVGGGGIYNQGSLLILEDTSVAGNTATASGGGIWNGGHLSINSSTIANNTAIQGNGGGIEDDSSGPLQNGYADCTIAGNSAAQGGGVDIAGTGVYEEFVNSTICDNRAALGGGINIAPQSIPGTQAIFNTIVAMNTVTNGTGASDISGTINAQPADWASGNLIGTGGSGGLQNGVFGNLVGVQDALLAPLGLYGGNLETMPPLPGSPAIAVGDANLGSVGFYFGSLPTDERGLPRLQGLSIDVGAVETQGYTLNAVAGSTQQIIAVNSAFAKPLAVTVTAVNGVDPINGGLVTFSVIPGANGEGAALSNTAGTIIDGRAAVSAIANSVAGTYSVTAAVGDASATFALTNSSGTPNDLVILSPQQSSPAGSKLSPVVVYIEDAYGNLVTDDDADVTLSLVRGPALSGTTTVAAIHGVATFTDLYLDTSGSYSFGATDSADAITGIAPSTPIVITPAAPAKFAFVQQPTNTVVGVDISPAVTVAVDDRFGNVVATDNSSEVTISVLSQQCKAAINRPVTVRVHDGIATFSGLNLEKAGVYALKATGDCLASVTSGRFKITPAAAARMIVIKPPVQIQPGKTFIIKAELLDKYGNLAKEDTSQVTLSVTNAPKRRHLDGIVTAAVVNGIAIFSDLSVNYAGSYTLVAADSDNILGEFNLEAQHRADK
jgi:hypothetical protein